MDAQGFSERLRRREQPLLQTYEGQPRQPGLPGRQGCRLCPQARAICCEHAGEPQVRLVVSEAGEPDWLDDPSGEALTEVPEVGFQTAHHDSVELARAHRHPTGEALGI